jgi:hypothetical protein
MKSVKLDNFALLCLGLGGGLLGLVALQSALTTVVPVPGYLWEATLVTGAATSMLGILLGIFVIFFSMQASAQGMIENVTFGWREQPHVVKFAGHAELPKLHKRYEQEFGTDIPALEQMRSWVDRCESGFALIYADIKKSGFSTMRKFVGSFKLLPVTCEAVRELEEERVTGSTLKPGHICATGDIPAAYYVGDLFAEGTARAAVLFLLDEKCRELTEGGFTIYARPFTAAGRRVMMNRGFVQVSNGSEDLTLRNLCRLMPPSSGAAKRKRSKKH